MKIIWNINKLITYEITMKQDKTKQKKSFKYPQGMI